MARVTFRVVKFGRYAIVYAVYGIGLTRFAEISKVKKRDNSSHCDLGSPVEINVLFPKGNTSTIILILLL